MNDQTQPPINRLIDWCHGRENDPDPAVATVARFIRNSGGRGLGRKDPIRRPTLNEPTRWKSIAEFKQHALLFGPNVITPAKIDVAAAAAGIPAGAV